MSAPPAPRARSALTILRSPGVMRALPLSLLARLPLGVVGLLVLLQARDLGLSYATGGVALSAFTLGIAVGAPLLGRLADRHGPAPVLHISAAISGAALVALGWAPAHPPVALVALCAVGGLAEPPVAACVRVIWTQLLERRDQEAVLALDIAGQQVVFVVGPLVLLPLASAAGPGVALQATGCVLAVATWAFALTPEARSARRPATAAQTSRARSVLAHGGVLTLVLLSSGLGASFGATEVGIVAFAEHHRIEGAVGALYGVWATGALVGGLLWAQHAPRGDRIAQVRRLLVTLAVADALLAAAGSPWVLGTVLLLAGAAVAPLLAVLYAMMGTIAPPQAVTEAYAWETTGVTGGIALGSALAGSAVGIAQAAGAFVVTAAAIALTGALLLARARTLSPTVDAAGR